LFALIVPSEVNARRIGRRAGRVVPSKDGSHLIGPI
jgi:hypothetical protein